MAHLTARSAYRDLVDRLNRFPQGAPPSDLLYGILAILFSEREAGLVALAADQALHRGDRGAGLEDDAGRGAGDSRTPRRPRASSSTH